MAILSLIEEATMDALEASGRVKALTRGHLASKAIHQAQTGNSNVLCNTERVWLAKRK